MAKKRVAKKSDPKRIRHELFRLAAQCCLDLYNAWKEHNATHLDVWEKKPPLTGRDYFTAIRKLALGDDDDDAS